MSEWQSNCDSTWVGNQHNWKEVKEKKLSLWKRIRGLAVFRCQKCGKEAIGYNTPNYHF